ncbi:thioredoxin family protein [Algoriphagus vanfongensis]|uniref:thioredoxin family protein n=1 Tax=Algoriphagus vanfongensis TaxID=426371 RepID=UPI00047BAE66|nr:thioredoxin family protein [Algoriphagus vanfongensis]
MQELLKSALNEEILDRAHSYPDYLQMIEQLVAENKTTGPNQSESYLEYTRMSLRRMTRWGKTIKISPEMESLTRSLPSQVWLVITEAWCGDAGQSVPYIQKLAELNPSIQLKLILRDEYPQIMDRYLTNGARSIPMMISFSPDLQEEYFVWGPRPEFLMQRLLEYKNDPKGVSSKEFSEGTHLWYAKDKHQSMEKELIQKFKTAFDL